jgi:hypothetical protein
LLSNCTKNAIRPSLRGVAKDLQRLRARDLLWEPLRFAIRQGRTADAFAFYERIAERLARSHIVDPQAARLRRSSAKPQIARTATLRI